MTGVRQLRAAARTRDEHTEKGRRIDDVPVLDETEVDVRLAVVLGVVMFGGLAGSAPGRPRAACRLAWVGTATPRKLSPKNGMIESLNVATPTELTYPMSSTSEKALFLLVEPEQRGRHHGRQDHVSGVEHLKEPMAHLWRRPANKNITRRP